MIPYKWTVNVIKLMLVKDHTKRPTIEELFPKLTEIYNEIKDEIQEEYKK